MLDIKIINGKNMVPISELRVWEKNDLVRNAKYSDFQRLQRQLDQLGQYKNLLVLEDGTIIGGNHRFRAMVELNDSRFENVWVSVLTFNHLEDGSFQAVIDNEPQKKTAPTEEQIKIEYMASDNDEVASWERDGLAQLMIPYKDTMPTEEYKFNLGYPIDGKTFLEEYNPGPINYPDESEEEKKAEDVKTVIARFSPDQYLQIEPLMEDFKTEWDIKNNTDMLTKLLEWWTHSKNIAGAIEKDEVRAVDTITYDNATETAAEKATTLAEDFSLSDNPSGQVNEQGDVNINTPENTETQEEEPTDETGEV